jgi:DNA-binding CsgD family transcriptional regulator
MNTYLTTEVHPLHDAAPLLKARSLWHAAQYTACLQTLDNIAPSAECCALAAWALYRLYRYDDALLQIEIGERYFGGLEKRIELDALRAVLHSIRGNRQESDHYAQRVMLNDPRRLDPRAYNMLALIAWQRGNYDETLLLIEPGEGCDDANIRGQALRTRAWVHASMRQFSKQAEFLRDAIFTVMSSPTPDIGLAAEILCSISILCRELYLPDIFSEIETVAYELRWTDDLRNQQYDTLRHLAWTHALYGNYVVGLRLLRRARTLASSNALTALSLLDSAAVASASNQQIAAVAYFDDATELIDGMEIDTWTAVDFRALLFAAEMAHSLGLAAATDLLWRYDTMKKRFSTSPTVRCAQAYDAIECYIRAMISARNNDSAAHGLAVQAYNGFVELEHDWRAARCALFLYQTGCGKKWLAAAQAKVRNYPRSFISVQLQAITGDAPGDALSVLTARQRQVLGRIVAGDTTEQAARALNVKLTTVQTHIRRIYRALDVHNRVELLRRIGNVSILY